MDEEEQRRQASAAAFGQANMIEVGEARRRALDPYGVPIQTRKELLTPGVRPIFQNGQGSAGYEDPNLATQMNRQRGAANGRTEGAEQIASNQDAFGGALPNRMDADDVANNYPEVQAAAWQQTGQLFGDRSSIPGASEAFAQLDQAPNADPTQFDDRMAEGTQEGVGEVLRQSFDENLRAARDAVAGQVRRAGRATGATGATGGSDGEIAQYRDRLLKMADQRLAGGGEQQRQPQDPYAQQREREALVAKRLGTFDLFSDSRTTRTPISAQTVQTDAYDKVLMGKDNKDLFDSFL